MCLKICIRKKLYPNWIGRSDNVSCNLEIVKLGLDCDNFSA